jgi:mannose-6-phosphate isomerase-like protein (cupin superfamily)
MTIDLHDLASGGPGIVWSQASEDFNLNLMVLARNAEIAVHVNGELDVLLIAVEGQATIAIDDRAEDVRAGQAIVIPRGAQRSMRAGSEGFAYLTCHRRRRGLWPAAPQRAER